MLPPFYTSLPDRFWAQVDDPDENGCWLWTGPTVYGYGQTWLYGKQQRCHRLTYRDKHGEFDSSLFILHHCDTNACVYPAHLFLGTTQDNMDDMVRKGRAAHVYGSKNGNSKLDEHMVKTIRNGYATGTISQAKLADLYEVREETIQRIISRKTWSHVR